MNNCIYTKLAAEVPNSDLLQFGELRFNVVKNTNNNINTKLRIVISGDAPEAPVMKAYGGTFSVDGVSKTEYTLTKGSNGLYTVVFDAINEDYTIGITNAKYYIRLISVASDGQADTNYNIFSFKTEDLNYSPYLSQIMFYRNHKYANSLTGVFNPISTKISLLLFYSPNVEYDLSVIGRQKYIEVVQTVCAISGNLSDIADSVQINSLYLQNSAVTGNIESLYKWTKNDIAIRVNGSANIGGSIDALADAMVARTNPKTSGTVDVYGINTSGITCSVAGDNIRITFDPSATKGYTLSAIAI